MAVIWRRFLLLLHRATPQQQGRRKEEEGCCITSYFLVEQASTTRVGPITSWWNRLRQPCRSHNFLVEQASTTRVGPITSWWNRLRQLGQRPLRRTSRTVTTTAPTTFCWRTGFDNSGTAVKEFSDCVVSGCPVSSPLGGIGFDNLATTRC